MALTQRITLRKPAGKFNAGDTINATLAAIVAAGLKPGDYEALGSHPCPVASDLPEPDEANTPAPERK